MSDLLQGFGDSLDAPHVLVVDDSAVLRAVVCAGLEGAGARVTTASDGEEALALAAADPPDVILLDIEMPGLSGFDVLGLLQEDPVLAVAPVVFLTGRASTEDLVEALEQGAHDYLQKPFEPTELIARVHAALRVKALQDTLRIRAAELDLVSRTDLLTGLPNRLDLEQVLRSTHANSARHGHEATVLVVDIDHFKQVNDRFGHEAGDRVLGEVAGRLRSAARAGDVVGRWGGEEFLAVLPMTSGPAGRTVADKLRAAVAARPIALGAAGHSVAVTVSIGAATGIGSGMEDLVRRADAALYLAKAAGRDRVEVAGGA